VDPGEEIGGQYGERGARAYNGGLGALPPDGSGEAGGEAPPEAVRFFCVVICLK